MDFGSRSHFDHTLTRSLHTRLLENEEWFLLKYVNCDMDTFDRLRVRAGWQFNRHKP
jgi:hypothetical protein